MSLNIELNSNAEECDEEWDVPKDGSFTDVEENEILEPCMATKLSKEGSMSSESFEIAYLGLKETLKKCAVVNQSLKSSKEPQCRHDGDGNVNCNTHQITVLDPQVSKTKGAPKRSRKSGTNKCNKRRCNKSNEVQMNDEVRTEQIESSSQKIPLQDVEKHPVASTIGLPLEGLRASRTIGGFNELRLPPPPPENSCSAGGRDSTTVTAGGAGKRQLGGGWVGDRRRFRDGLQGRLGRRWLLGLL
ncbi:hypothetical protein M0R45_009304 [Rubus argutus]|uniref:Uncharacterized protein n=1 Tax=Rubus argutus TaxID=59490 RepID=A0AAW1Y3K0_RUBAR